MYDNAQQLSEEEQNTPNEDERGLDDDHQELQEHGYEPDRGVGRFRREGWHEGIHSRLLVIPRGKGFLRRHFMKFGCDVEEKFESVKFQIRKLV